MDVERFTEFTAYGPYLFASFVADLWERAGYDCSLVDERDGPNVVARRENGGVIRIAAVVDAEPDPAMLVDADGTPAVDVVVVPLSTAEVRVPPGVEVFDAGRLAELVEQFGASTLVDDYLLERDVARERVRSRRESTNGASGNGHDHNEGAADPLNLTRSRAFTLVVAGIVGLCLGTSLGESVGGVLATLLLNGSYLFLIGGMVFDARSLGFTGFTGSRGLALVASIGFFLFIGIVSPLWAALAGGLYLVQRRRVERAYVPDDGALAWTPLGRQPWYWAVVAGTVGWPVAAVGAASPGGFNAGTAVVGLGSWLAVPLGLTFHGRRTEAPPSRRLLVLGTVPYLGSLAGLVYVVRRERERNESDASAEEGDADQDGARFGRRVGRQVGRLSSTLGTRVGSLLDATVRRDSDGPTDENERGAGRSDSDADSRERSASAASTGATDGEQRRTTGTADSTSDASTAGSGDDTSDESESGGSGTRDDPGWTAADLGPPVRRPPRESRTVRHDGVDFRCTSVASRNGRWRVAWGAATVEEETRERVFLLQYEARQATVETVSVSECAVGDGGTVAVVESDGDDVSRLRVLTPSGAVVVDRGFEGEVRSVAVAEDGERPLVGVGVRSPARLVVLNGRSGEEIREVEVGADPDAVEFREGAGDQWLVAGRETRPAPDAAVRVHDGELVQ